MRPNRPKQYYNIMQLHNLMAQLLCDIRSGFGVYGGLIIITPAPPISYWFWSSGKGGIIASRDYVTAIC